MLDGKINRQIESDAHKKVDLTNVWNQSKILKGKLEKVRFESASEDRARWIALISYDRQFHIAGAAQRKARDSIFVWEEHVSSCLSPAEDLSPHRKILLGMRDLRYGGSPDSRSLYVKVAIL